MGAGANRLRIGSQAACPPTLVSFCPESFCHPFVFSWRQTGKEQWQNNTGQNNTGQNDVSDAQFAATSWTQLIQLTCLHFPVIHFLVDRFRILRADQALYWK